MVGSGRAGSLAAGRRPTGEMGATAHANGPVRYARRVNALTTEQIILLLAPVVLIQLGLMVAALIDLERGERRVRGGNKLVWVLVIVFVNIIGPILYFVAGREEET